MPWMTERSLALSPVRKVYFFSQFFRDFTWNVIKQNDICVPSKLISSYLIVTNPLLNNQSPRPCEKKITFSTYFFCNDFFREKATSETVIVISLFVNSITQQKQWLMFKNAPKRWRGRREAGKACQCRRSQREDIEEEEVLHGSLGQLHPEETSFLTVASPAPFPVCQSGHFVTCCSVNQQSGEITQLVNSVDHKYIQLRFA